MVGSSSGGSPSHASIDVWAIGPLRPHRPRGGTWTSGTPVRTACSSAEPVPIRPARQEVVAERLEGPRLLVDEGAAHRHDLVEVDACQALAELALLDPIHDRLDERPEAPRVPGGDEVDRPAHQRHPHDGPIDQQVGELLAPEVHEAGPEPDVRGVRGLGLHPDEMLERRRDRQRGPAQEELSIERGAVQGADAEGLAGGRSLHRLMVPPREPHVTGPGTGRPVAGVLGSTGKRNPRTRQRRRSQPCAATSPGSLGHAHVSAHAPVAHRRPDGIRR